MPWFRHHFHCEACDGAWLCEHSVELTGDCPYCGARDAFPYKSDDRSLLVEPATGGFVVLAAAARADGEADWRELGRFPSRAAAQAFLAAR